jgi:hypothetical protein
MFGNDAGPWQHAALRVPDDAGDFPGSTPPCASRTTPEISPVLVWALSVAFRTRKPLRTAARRVRAWHSKAGM